MTHNKPWWVRAYDVALQAFPEGFRERWGGEMRQTFLDRVAATASAAGSPSWRLLRQELVNLIASGLRERFHSNSRQLQMMHLRDVRYALRLLARSPGFSLLTVIVLAGGLGLSTFTFSFLHTAMIRAIPLGEGDRIVRVDAVIDGRRQGIDAADITALRASLSTLSELSGYTGREILVGRDGDRRVVDATVAEPSLFGVARTPAFLGRALIGSDGAPGAEPVIVLSYRTWEVAFGADRALVNRHIAVNGVSTRVVGVMPERFGFPVASEAWIPLDASAIASSARPGLTMLRLVGRLAPGATHKHAAGEAGPVLQRALASRDSSVRASGISAAVESFPAVQFGEERALAFTVLNVLAALILLLALVNVTNLLLARANERIRETAVRLALGASSGRLVMQGMWETVILCVAGGIVGTAGAAWGLAAITRWTRANMEENLAFWWVWQADHITLLCAGAFVTAAIAVLGGVVSVRTLRTNVREVMQDGSARSGSRREGRLSRALVTTQVATVTVLMFFGVMSGVVARRVLTLDPGYDITNLLQAGIILPPARYETAAKRAVAFRNVHAQLAEHEAFDQVILRNTLADQRSREGRFALRDDRLTGAVPAAHIQAALGSLSTFGVEIAEGRPFHDSEDMTGAPVAIVSRSLAERYWRGRSPVGGQVRLSVGDTLQWRTIVGVASDVPFGNPLSRDRSPDAIYVPLLQSGSEWATVVVRYRASEVAGREALLQAFGAVDPFLVPDSVQPFTEVLRKVGLITTSLSRLFGACFAFALLLAMVGTYGLMSRSIGLRKREIGVRRALGASDASVTRLLLGQGGRQLGVGTLIAAPILVAVGVGFMHFVPISGWLTAALGLAVSASIIAVVLGATWVPARHVLRVTPRDALWIE